VSDELIEVRSPSPGVLLQFLVEAGARAAEGDELAIIECMKLEIPVQAPAGGVVHEFKSEAGDRVNEDDVLLVLRHDGAAPTG
jgi:acetyl-CoA carboxylase biotin carboxyl carrier protein